MSVKRSIRKSLDSGIFAMSLATLAFASGASIAQSNSADIERGRYLATAGNCVSCHTTAGGAPFAGGRRFETEYGVIYSTNITPDTTTGIGAWTEQEFAAALRKGVRPNGEHLYPAFPYTAYTKLNDQDVSALYSYIKSLPPANAEAPKNELKFPYNQRWALRFWKMLYFDEGRFEPDPSQSAEWNRGAYLTNGLAHCGECHSPRNFLGGQSTADAMTGGELMDLVPGGFSRKWSAPNLTSAPNGLESWPLEELAAYLKTGRNEFTDTFGPMNEVIMNSTSQLTDADVRAMAVYFKGLPANAGKAPKTPSEAVVAEGSVLYDIHCGICHLPTGLSTEDEEGGATLAGNPVVQAEGPSSLINVILYGPERPNPPLPMRWREMPGFDDKLTDDEVAALATFLRTAWGNKAGPVSAADVAAQR